MVASPEPDPETVAALLDTTWRVADAEGSRTVALDGKAATLATFASLVLSLSATLGGRLIQGHVATWALALFALSLLLLVMAVVVSVWVLLPKETAMLGIAYLERFPMWSEIRKPRARVQGETMTGLVAAIALERQTNRKKARAVHAAFLLLVAGLAVTAADAAIVTADAVL